ncbi:hypothetical protein CWO91_29375 [Bradyrhizobium genosp. SA-3]|nr:hypothetical protein CWO91_29375 [Bradyrhizobium genosp. SA-3]
MPGLVPGIHVLGHAKDGVDGQVKPGHDEVWSPAIRPSSRRVVVRRHHFNSRISAFGGWPNNSMTDAGSSWSRPSNSSA